MLKNLFSGITSFANVGKMGFNILIVFVFLVIVQKFFYFALQNMMLIKNTFIYFLSSSYIVGPITVQAFVFFICTFCMFTIFRVFRNLF